MFGNAITIISGRKNARPGTGTFLSKVVAGRAKAFVPTLIFLMCSWGVVSCTKEETLGGAAGGPYPEPIQQLDYAGEGLFLQEVLNPFDSLGAEPDSTTSSIIQDDLINP